MSFFLAASQQLEEQQNPTASSSTSKRVTRSQSARFAVPVSGAELQKKVLAAVPEKTRQQTKWAIGIWMNWRLHQITITKTPDECPLGLYWYKFAPDFVWSTTPFAGEV